MTTIVDRTFSVRWRTLAGVLAVTGVFAFAQAPAGGRGGRAGGDPNASSDTDKRPYDKHDFTGLWSRNPQQFKLPACPECRDVDRPRDTASSATFRRGSGRRKKFQLNKPGRGYELGSKEANAHPEIDIGLRRAVIPALGNDPEARCEPLGLARLVAFSGGGASMEMVQAKDQIVQIFEWTWDTRQIWLDGRKLPKVEDYLPRYNGYSVSKWEGDTLVVTTTGFDDRQWVDQYGYPISDKMVLEDLRRPSPNRLRATMTITDPEMARARGTATPRSGPDSE
jgi:hypothetical protein